MQSPTQKRRKPKSTASTKAARAAKSNVIALDVGNQNVTANRRAANLHAILGPDGARVLDSVGAGTVKSLINALEPLSLINRDLLQRLEHNARLEVRRVRPRLVAKDGNLLPGITLARITTRVPSGDAGPLVGGHRLDSTSAAAQPRRPSNVVVLAHAAERVAIVVPRYIASREDVALARARLRQIVDAEPGSLEWREADVLRQKVAAAHWRLKTGV